MGPAIWLAMAREDLRAAEVLAEHGIAPLSCLHAEQAVEKALQALHLHRSGPVEISFRTASDARPGTKRPGIAAALASLRRRSATPEPTAVEREADIARQAV